jgi:hypothetical protein
VRLKRIVGSNTFLLLLAAALVLVSLLGRVAARTRLVRLGYEVSALETERQALETELQALRTELLSRHAPDQMLKDGRQRFHLDYPRPEQIVSIASGPAAAEKAP